MSDKNEPQDRPGAGAPVHDRLLELLVCPQCSQKLEYDRTAGTFTCHHCRLRFSVVDGIPNFLIEEAERI